MNKSDFAIFIKNRRKELGMTQEELASRIHVSRKVVSKWENGERYPDLETTQLLIEALSVSSQELFEKSSINDNKTLHIVRNVLVGIAAAILLIGTIMIPISLHKHVNAVDTPSKESTEIFSDDIGIYITPNIFVQGNSATQIIDNYIYTMNSDGEYKKACASSKCSHDKTCPAYVDNYGISFIYNGKRILIIANELIHTADSIKYTSNIYEFDIDNTSRNYVKKIECHIGKTAALFGDKLYFVASFEDSNIMKYVLYALELNDYTLTEIACYDGAYYGFETQLWFDEKNIYFSYISFENNEAEYEQRLYNIMNDKLVEINIPETKLLNYIGVCDGRIYYRYHTVLNEPDEQYIYYYEKGEINKFIPVSDALDMHIVGKSIIVESNKFTEGTQYEYTISRYSLDGNLIESRTLKNMRIIIYGTVCNTICYIVFADNQYSDVYIGDINKIFNSDLQDLFNS